MVLADTALDLRQACSFPPGAAARGQAGRPGAWKMALDAYIWASEQLSQSPVCLDSWS